MKRKFILVFLVVIAMGMTACSSESKEDAISVNTDSWQETDQEETADTKTAEAETDDMEPSKPEIIEDIGTDRQEIGDIEDISIEDIPQGDPIAGIVEEYEGNTITVRTLEDDMLYHFFTENVPILKGFSTESAQAVEGDFQIVAGDKVEVSYRGLLDSCVTNLQNP